MRFVRVVAQRIKVLRLGSPTGLARLVPVVSRYICRTHLCHEYNFSSPLG